MDIIRYASIEERERAMTGKSPTNNQQFDRDGFLFLENFTDVSKFFEPKPNVSGTYEYESGKLRRLSIDAQVEDSLSRYKVPKYRDLQFALKPKLEKIVGKKLYPTFNYDRFYSPGQVLRNHLDRFSCEISISLHISTNLKHPWPLFFKKEDTYNEKGYLLKKGEVDSVIFSNPGDAVLYKGCERPHWRDEMPSNYNKMQKKFQKLLGKNDDTYYHQVFIHYVLADGIYSHMCVDYLKTDWWAN